MDNKSRRTRWNIFEDIVYLSVMFSGILALSWGIAHLIDFITSVRLSSALIIPFAVLFSAALYCRVCRKVEEKNNLIRHYEGEGE